MRMSTKPGTQPRGDTACLVEVATPSQITNFSPATYEATTVVRRDVTAYLRREG